VAVTIGKGILTPGAIDQWTLLAALFSAVTWVVAATYWGLPVSVSHSLIAGLVGAGLATAGTGVISWGKLEQVLASVATAPVLGFIFALTMMVALMWIFRRTAPTRVRNISNRLQLLSAAFMAYSHGKNDGQMPMGVMALALVLYNGGEFHIPFWIVALSAASISLGTAFGGWRVIKTVGLRITALQPIHGFAAQSSAATVIEVASLFGIPVSTTHCMSSSIMGVGSVRRFSAVRWGIAGNIAVAWVATFPICIGLGWLLCQLFKAAF
jgi:PiT family inorganic phosphate transporter